MCKQCVPSSVLSTCESQGARLSSHMHPTPNLVIPLKHTHTAFLNHKEALWDQWWHNFHTHTDHNNMVVCTEYQLHHTLTTYHLFRHVFRGPFVPCLFKCPQSCFGSFCNRDVHNMLKNTWTSRERRTREERRRRKKRKMKEEGYITKIKLGGWSLKGYCLSAASVT